MSDTTYNGWRNYATWRINLEVFDGRGIKDQYPRKPDAFDVAHALKEELLEHLELDCNNKLTLSYAESFVSDVDFVEIAEHLIENAEYDETEEDDE